MTGSRWVGTACVCFALSSFSQETPLPPVTTGPTLIPRSHEEQENRYRSLHRIILNLVVTDRSGKVAHGLQESDFTLLDNGRLRKIQSLRAVDGSKGPAPVRIIFMLDTVNNSPRDIKNDRKGIEQFLKEGPGRLTYPTSIGILMQTGTRVFPASQDRDVVLEELQTMSREVHSFECTDEGGGTVQVFTTLNRGTETGSLEGLHPDQRSGCLNQRFLHSLSALKRFANQQEDVPGRVILIWIGSGWPLLLNPEFRDDSTAVRGNLFDNLVLVSTELREAQVTLDAVFSPDLYRKIEQRSDHDNALFNGVPSQDQMTASSLGLQMLAHQSGGQILIQSKDLGNAIGKCIDDADFYYALTFDSPAANGPGEFHSLQVNVNQPGLTVRTNTAYYSQP